MKFVAFSKLGRRNVEATFDGGDIVSDGGMLLLREVNRQLELTRAAAVAIGGDRRANSVRHGMREMLAQRI